jgi:hypothetical protein
MIQILPIEEVKPSDRPTQIDPTEYDRDFNLWIITTAELLRTGRDAKKQARIETQLAIATFPDSSPFTPSQCLDEDFLPEYI